jgi:16S rRNA (uracil1498-N3)-methyltransferase
MTRFAARSPAAAHAFASALDDDVTLDGASGHHLSRVRRLRSGELVTIANGNGTWRPYTVSVVRPGALELHAGGARVVEPRLEPVLAVAFALTKAGKPDLAVQKLTELGVDRIVPLHSSRSVPRWETDRAGVAVARLRRIAVEAAAQSRRARLPVVETPRPLADLRGHPGLVVADPGGDDVGRIPRPPDGEWTLVIGPEGGLDPDEMAALSGAARLRIGPHVLRAETAAIAGAAVLTTRRANAPDHPR